MTYLRNFGMFWYDFIVGDDWTIAAGAVAIMAATWGLQEMGFDAWWLMPLAFIGLLYATVRRAARG